MTPSEAIAFVRASFADYHYGSDESQTECIAALQEVTRERDEALRSIERLENATTARERRSKTLTHEALVEGLRETIGFHGRDALETWSGLAEDLADRVFELLPEVDEVTKPPITRAILATQLCNAFHSNNYRPWLAVADLALELLPCKPSPAAPVCNCHPEERTGGLHDPSCPEWDPDCSCYEMIGGHQPGCHFHARAPEPLSAEAKSQLDAELKSSGPGVDLGSFAQPDSPDDAPIHTCEESAECAACGSDWVKRMKRQGSLHSAGAQAEAASSSGRTTEVQRPIIAGAGDAGSNPAAAGVIHPALPAAIESAINIYSAENGSDTPDFILADYLIDCLKAFNSAVIRRAKWYGTPKNYYVPSSGSGDAAPREAAVAAGSSAVTNSPDPGGHSAPSDGRCDVCGWTLAASIKEGCIPGNCSMRPRPPVTYREQQAAQKSAPSNRECSVCKMPLELLQSFQLIDAEGRTHFLCRLCMGQKTTVNGAPSKRPGFEELCEIYSRGCGGIDWDWRRGLRAVLAEIQPIELPSDEELGRIAWDAIHECGARYRSTPDYLGEVGAAIRTRVLGGAK